MNVFVVTSSLLLLKTPLLPHSLLFNLLIVSSITCCLLYNTRLHRRLDKKKLLARFRLYPVKKTMSTPSDDPPAFDPLEPSVPVSYPIKTLEELASRSYFDSFHYPFNKSSVPLQLNQFLPDRPRILVCHDLQGGYRDDKWIQGGQNASAFALWHWYLMDVFVYFSHTLVTLPPPCWTNTAHRHGVKVLGTFITEWEEGTIICNTLLESKESAQMYAERLAELAVALGFDGWLLNLENKLDVEQIPNLQEFVSHLTKTMHSSVPGSLVIWYDSVTIKGELKWQNQLNENNKLFFDACDGIFINYTWKEDYPKFSADVAGDRKFDVYMGIDIFGRGSYGGGQWNTHVALGVLKKDNVSAALFAPGWIYESDQSHDFQTAQNKWWALVEKSWGTLQTYPNVLPFYSDFDQGRGYHIFSDGTQVSDVAWDNISCQGLQPFLEFRDKPTPDPIQVLVNLKEASYSGGGNITFKGTLQDNAHFTTRLFKGELNLGDSPIYLAYSVKSEGNSQLGLLLQFSSTMNGRKSIVVAYEGPKLFYGKFSDVVVPLQVDSPDMAAGWVVLESNIAMIGYTLTEIHALCYKPKTDIHRLILESSSCPAEYFSVLGDIKIKTLEQNSRKPDFPPSSSWLVEYQYLKLSSDPQGSRILSCKLTWKLKVRNDSLFSKYNIYVEKLEQGGFRKLGEKLTRRQEYLGVAQVEAYYVFELKIPAGTKSLKFIIQACTVDGSYQKLDDSPSLQLDVEGQ